MSSLSYSTKRFLLAAKHAELNSLHALSSNCLLVTAATQVIHQLQRERGIANVYLGSRGTCYKNNLTIQHQKTSEVEQDLRSLLKAKYLGSHSNHVQVRLLSAVTFALQGLDQLSTLRKQVKDIAISSLKSTDAYCRLIGKIINVIFEAADVSGDASITKMLVSLFNFIKGKELAGQERAWGAIGFSQQQHDTHIILRMQELVSAQQDSFKRFLKFAADEETLHWQKLQDSEVTIEIQKLRTMIKALAENNSYTPELGEIWYEVATKRIDELLHIENMLTARLMNQVKQRITEAEGDISNHNILMEKIIANSKVEFGFNLLFDKQFSGLHGAEISGAEHQEQDVRSGHKSFYDLICEQASHINQMNTELEKVRLALHEQKIIDRAKLLLIQQSKLAEHQAYQSLQQAAMSQNLTIAQVARKIVEKTEKQ